MFGPVGVGGGWVRSDHVRDRGPGGWGGWWGRRTRWSRHQGPGSSDWAQGYGRVGVRVHSGEVRRPGFGWARQPLWRARPRAPDRHSLSGWAGDWVRRCQKSSRRGPGQDLVWKEERRSAGRGRAPGRRTLTRRPAVRAVRVAGARRLQQLQQPLLVALAVAHGWPGGLSGAQPRSPLACRPPRALSSRRQVKSDAAPPPPERQPRPSRLPPRPRRVPAAPSPARPALLPRLRPAPRGATGAQAGEQTLACRLLVAGLWTTQSASLASVSTSAKGE